jgi:type 1 glutamine amidotransferase
MKRIFLAILLIGITCSLYACGTSSQSDQQSKADGSVADAERYRIVYKGEKGPGVGKHIVFLASDHEYRSEESLPALARILAKHHGFTCTVIFGLDKSGNIFPGSSDIKGLAVLGNADLLVIFARFLDLPDDEMQHIDVYLKSGKPVVGLRTSTHAFSNKTNPKYGHYSWDYKGEKKDWADGFGERVLGETWVTHYGTNHKQSSRLLIEENQSEHPIMRGVKEMAVQSGAYTTYPKGVVLARGQVLNGMTPDSEPDKTKELLPVAWIRDYAVEEGKTGRAFATSHGASEDLLNTDFRRMLVNSTFWALGMESDIKGDNNVSFVGPYKPTRFDFDGYKANVKPGDLADWNSLIMPGEIFKKK